MNLSVEIYKKLGNFSLSAAFTVEEGLLGILGASGSGKSMTLKCIAGIEKPDSGRILLDGVSLFDSAAGINLPPQHRRIGYLFQNYALFPNMTVRQNILCGMHRERDRAKQQAALAKMLAAMQLGGLENHRPAALSGGQQQRTALARILVSEPKLLLLDEPFSALDSHLRGRLQLETKDLLRDFGIAAILVTHSRTEVYRLCETTAVIEAGQLLTLKPTKSLFVDPETREIAQLTGCKNLTHAKKIGPYELEAPAWGVRLTCALPLRDELCAVGIRAHSFDPTAAQNARPVLLTGEAEEPFEWAFRFRFATAAPDAPDLGWRVSKDRPGHPFPAQLGVAPEQVLPLYPAPFNLENN